MKVSYNWLQTYFQEPLPSPEKVAELFTFGMCEVEGIKHVGGDFVFDFKVLPDRASYALSHRGIAYELSLLSRLPLREKVFLPIAPTIDTHVEATIALPLLCERYTARYIAGVTFGESEQTMRTMLEAVDNRSINNIVDATNYCMLDLGQPLHAFDADKIVGAITVRNATPGETIELLPERNVTAEGVMTETPRTLTLKADDIVVADSSGPIALAGIKGGLRSAISSTTKNIIVESAHFNPTYIRRSAARYGLKNESSKRFENNLSAHWTLSALHEVSELISGKSPRVSLGSVTDIYPLKENPVSISISQDMFSQLLGVDIPPLMIEQLLSSLLMSVEKRGSEYVVIPPVWRKDIASPEDLIEEVGRLYGYEKISPLLPPPSTVPVDLDPLIEWTRIIKQVLAQRGFSEVQTYSLTHTGEIAIQNPLSSDKGYLRNNLRDGLEGALLFNSKHADLLGLDTIKIFEIGTVFTKEGEYIACAIGAMNVKGRKAKKESEEIEEALVELSQVCGSDMEKVCRKEGAIVECNLSALAEKISLPKKAMPSPPLLTFHYKPISPYPFIVRDIAVFVPENVTREDIEHVLRAEGGALAVTLRLFDVFTKEFADGSKKISYAFRIVFQSQEKTLTDAEINPIMEKITRALNSNVGWRVR